MHSHIELTNLPLSKRNIPAVNRQAKTAQSTVNQSPGFTLVYCLNFTLGCTHPRPLLDIFIPTAVCSTAYFSTIDPLGARTHAIGRLYAPTPLG